MRQRRTHIVLAAAAAFLPFALWGYANNPNGPPIRRTGAAIDGGLTCTACHRPGASLAGGSVDIQTSDYKPGVKQMIRVRVQHPAALRWGFQLTARLASDLTKKAGTFTVTDLIRVRCDDTGVQGSPGPCSDDKVEFAAHMTAATQLGQHGTMDFMVEWTPPATDVGNVVFYAAGNAANRSFSPSGDRIYNTVKTINYDYGCNWAAKPTITSVVNAASGNPTLGWNSLITIFGSGFAPTGRSREVRSDDFKDDRIPTSLACMSVYADDQPVPVVYVNENQINAQVPALSGIAAGNIRLSVGVKSGETELRSDETTAPYQVVSPGFFTYNGKSVAARLQDFSVLADPAVVAGGKFAKPGDMVILYGTGFGIADPFWKEGEIVAINQPRLPTLRADMTPVVTVGGVTLAPEDIVYLGLAPLSISGLYQMNIKIPASTGAGDIPVTLTVKGVSTQAGATIPVRP